MVGERTRGRGQLILVGALLLATVIFGLSLLLNSMLFTGATGDTGAGAAVEETNHLDFDVELSARELLVRLNHGDRNRTATELGDVAENQVSNFSRALAESKARSSSMAVNVTYNNDSSSFGRRILQTENADISDDDGDLDWTPVDGDARVGWFSLNVNGSATDSGDGISIVARNGTSGKDVTLDLTMNDTGIEVDSKPSWGAKVSDFCGAERSQILLDLYAGSGFTDNCEFPGIGTLDRPTTIEVDADGEFYGKYAIVTNSSTSTIEAHTDPCGPGIPADPCAAPAIWEATVTTIAQGDSVQFATTDNVTVYTNER